MSHGLAALGPICPLALHTAHVPPCSLLGCFQIWGQDISPWGKVGTWGDKGNLEINREQRKDKEEDGKGGMEKAGEGGERTQPGKKGASSGHMDVQGQAGRELEQPGPVAGVPAHSTGVGTR